MGTTKSDAWCRLIESRDPGHQPLDGLAASLSDWGSLGLGEGVPTLTQSKPVVAVKGLPPTIPSDL